MSEMRVVVIAEEQFISLHKVAFPRLPMRLSTRPRSKIFPPDEQEHRGDPNITRPMGRTRHIAGQRELKRRAAFPIYTSPQTTTVRLDNPPTDGQSHADTLRFGGEEGIEYAIDFSHREADA